MFSMKNDKNKTQKTNTSRIKFLPPPPWNVRQQEQKKTLIPVPKNKVKFKDPVSCPQKPKLRFFSFGAKHIPPKQFFPENQKVIFFWWVGGWVGGGG